jgi:hypothetical protein
LVSIKPGAIQTESLEFIGKEANRLHEHGEGQGTREELLVKYHDPEHFHRYIVPGLKSKDRALVASRAEISVRALRSLLNGSANPRADNHRRLLDLL